MKLFRHEWTVTMSVKHEPIAVRVSQRILWFGSEAYPLHNITRTNTLVITANRSAAIRRFVISAGLSLVFGLMVLGVSPGVFSGLIFAGVLAFIVFRAIKLSELLKLKLHELVIETAAGSHRGLVTNSQQVVKDLAFRITDAINNPMAEVQMQIENYNVGGDQINMIGGVNPTGKVIR